MGLTTLERSENSLRSVAFAEKPLKYSLLTVEGDYFQDLTQKSNSATLQYLPEASYFTEYVPILKQKAYVDLSSDLTNFMDGKGDRFTRFVATPTVRVPYSVSGFNFLFSGGLTEKSYSDNQSSPNSDNALHHETYTIGGDANAQFVRNGTTDLFNIGQFQSVISPRVDYSYIKNDESFSNIPSLDPSDRTSNANVMTYSFNHYFNAVKDGATREISLFEIQQSYGLSGDLQPQPYLYYGSGNRLSDVHAGSPYSSAKLLPRSRGGFQHTRRRLHDYDKQRPLCGAEPVPGRYHPQLLEGIPRTGDRARRKGRGQRNIAQYHNEVAPIRPPLPVGLLLSGS